jgi:sugar phosphate permease
MQPDLAKPREIGRFRWRIVRVLVALAVFLYVDRINITVAAPSLSLEFHLTPPELGRVLSAFLFGYAVGLIPGGYLADRLGPHRLIAAAGVLWGVVTILTACVPSQLSERSAAEGILMAARFALGICEACAFPTFNRALANWMLKSERAQASGWVHCGAGIGGALTPLFMAVLIRRSGWRMAFLVSGMLTWAITAWWWVMAADHPSSHPRVSADEAAAIMKDQEGGAQRELPGLHWLGGAARSPDAWLLCASMFSFGIAQFVYITWFYTYFVKARGATAINAAVLASLPYAAIALGSPAGGLLCDAALSRLGHPWGRRIVPLIALLLAAVCASIAPAITRNSASAALFALAAGFQYSAASAYWSTAIDLTRQGTGILGGFMNASTYLGSALATAAFPLFVERIGWTLSIQYAAVAAVAASMTWLAVNPGRQIDP